MFHKGYFMVARVCSALFVIMLLGSVSAIAAGQDNQTDIYNKLKLFEWLVNDSPMSKRVEEYKDETVKQQLKRAREMLDQAVEHSDRNEYALAEGHINEGLKLMTRISRKVKDEDRIERARTELYNQVKDHVDMFVVAFDRIAKEKGEVHINDMLDKDKLDSLLSSADREFMAGDLVMANHLMRQAADLVDNALSDARHEDVLLRELSFENLEQEYAYEVQRNESYVMLIDLMQKKTAPSQASASYVKKMIAANAMLREEADQLFKQGDLEQGITILERGTDKLSRALRVSGASF
jgi:hypothetical protein